MSKMHEVAEQDLQNEMQLKVARMERDLAEDLNMSIPSAVIAIQQMTASHLAMWDRASAATFLRETASLLAEEIDHKEFMQRVSPIFDVLAAEYERQNDATNN